MAYFIFLFICHFGNGSALTVGNKDRIVSETSCTARGIGYGSVNHPVDRDPVCGYTGVIDDVCPRCGRREGEAISIEKLNELRKKFPDIPVYLDANH